MTTGLLTTIAGRNAIIADLGGGTDLVLTHVAWGDASGVPYNPNEAQIALVNEKYRATIASVAVVAGAIVVDAVIPADTNDSSGRPSHGFSVAEVGLFNNAGVLIGVARCGNGYKPPPSSGQAHDVTYRLKLAVANPSAISVVVDPQSQIAIGRMVRPGWITVDGVLNVPPASPAMGATYIVGAAPTGAWSGFAHRLAQWVGVWSLCDVPLGHHAVDNSKGVNAGGRWLERTATGWSPGVSRLVQAQPGNYAVAGGTANALTVTLDPAPGSLAILDGTPIRFVPPYTNAPGVALTLKVNDLTARPVIRPDGSPAYGADFRSNILTEVIYSATSDAFIIQTPGQAISPLSRVFEPPSAAYVISPSDKGALCFQRANLLTAYTLPNPDVFGVGYVGFQNNMGAGLTVATGSAGYLTFMNNPFCEFISLSRPKSFLVLFCDGVNWLVFSADAGLEESLGQNLSAGWRKSPGGSVEQWGSTVVTVNANGDATITFPVSFPIECSTVVVSQGDLQDRVVAVIDSTRNAASFGVRVYGLVSNTARVNWIAKGR